VDASTVCVACICEGNNLIVIMKPMHIQAWVFNLKIIGGYYGK